MRPNDLVGADVHEPEHAEADESREVPRTPSPSDMPARRSAVRPDQVDTP
ncbi:hypothetical protein [Actinokineospora sp.]